jgi:hypothetical protein
MEVQAILLENRYFCTLFRLVEHRPEPVATKEAATKQELGKWLSESGFPDAAGTILTEREPGLLDRGFYIQPHMTEQFYRVDGDEIAEVASEKFGESLSFKAGELS